MIWNLAQLLRASVEARCQIDGEWLPARPANWRYDLRSRTRAAWLVLRGRADAVIWPGGQ